MTSFRFLHAADLHLDSPLRGLSNYEGAPVERLRSATREAFRNLCSLAIGERVDFVVLAGDLYDGDWPDYNTGLFFVSELARLGRAGVRVVLLHGNHDAQSRMTRSLILPEHVRVFDAKAPESLRFDDLEVAFHGQSFKTQKVEANLARGYPAPVPGLVNIGVLHTAVGGAEGHETYAPCSLADLRDKGYDYWALGHVHTRATLSTDPWIVFPGNTQGRHARELGPKGCLLVDVVRGVVREPSFQPLDVVRWQIAPIDAAGAEDLASILLRFEETLAELVEGAEGRLLALRVELHGRTPLHGELLADRDRVQQELRARAFNFGDDVFLEKLVLSTTDTGGAGEHAVDERAVLDWIGPRPTNADDLVPGVEHPLHGKLPAPLQGDWADTDPERLLDEAYALLTEELKRGGGT